MIVEIDTVAATDEVLQVVGPRGSRKQQQVPQAPTVLDGQGRFAKETCSGGVWVAEEPNVRMGTPRVPP